MTEMSPGKRAQMDALEQLLDRGYARVRDMPKEDYSPDTAKRALRGLENDNIAWRPSIKSKTWFIGKSGIDFVERCGYLPPEPDFWNEEKYGEPPEWLIPHYGEPDDNGYDVDAKTQAHYR